ncbi:MAG: MBL fold metallo-hydrolase [Promethearchaeota archaeon]
MTDEEKKIRKKIRKKKLGIAVDYGDFIIVRPKQNYRMNSNITIIKGKNPIVIDSGTPRNPGIRLFKKTLSDYHINPLSIKYIIITHEHQDHALNLFKIQKVCKNAKVICNINILHKVQHQFSQYKGDDEIYKLMGISKMKSFVINIIFPLFFMVYYQTIPIYPRIDYCISNNIKHSGLYLEKLTSIKSGDIKIWFIPTPGHSIGHLSILDSNGNLYLGDIVPSTPWIEPSKEALNDMILSIKNILSLDDKLVKLTVRAHGDFRKKKWEVSDWKDEKAKFKVFLEKILSSLEKIPLILKNPLTIQEITRIIFPRSLKYSSLMSLFTFSPSISWSIAYCLKLEKDGKIQRKLMKNQIYWLKN